MMDTTLFEITLGAAIGASLATQDTLERVALLVEDLDVRADLQAARERSCELLAEVVPRAADSIDWESPKLREVIEDSRIHARNLVQEELGELPDQLGGIECVVTAAATERVRWHIVAGMAEGSNTPVIQRLVGDLLPFQHQQLSILSERARVVATRTDPLTIRTTRRFISTRVRLGNRPMTHQSPA